MLFSREEKGQGLVEYAFILVLVAIVVLVALLVLGPVVGNTFSLINSSLSKVWRWAGANGTLSCAGRVPFYFVGYLFLRFSPKWVVIRIGQILQGVEISDYVFVIFLV